MARILGEYWGAIAAERCDPDAALLEQVLAFSPKFVWPSEPVLFFVSLLSPWRGLMGYVMLTSLSG